MKNRITRITVAPDGEPIFSERATHIEIEDEAGGEFVKIKQDENSISIDVEEWPALRAAINKTFKTISNYTIK